MPKKTPLKIKPSLLGKKGELLITNRLLKDYEVFFPYFDRGIDLIVKKLKSKRFYTIQCKTRNFTTRGDYRIMSIKKKDFHKRLKRNLDFFVFVVYNGESDIHFVVFPISWIKKMTKILDKRGVKKNYTFPIHYKDGKIFYKPKLKLKDKSILNISKFVDRDGWKKLK